MRPLFEVADVLNQHWAEVESHPKINSWQLRTLGAIKRCRTSEMGFHEDACTNCGVMRISYNSCRNRHCPKCQGAEREKWMSKRQEELLPVPYFHVVFTLPDSINTLAMYKPKEVYDTLFESAWETLHQFGRNPKHLGAEVGMISILHTWGQTLNLHPHIHCIVPGGGLSKEYDLLGNPEYKWIGAKSEGKYLFCVKALSAVFRGKFMEKLKTKILDLDKKLIRDLYKNNWIVYAKEPFQNPASVVEYLGRYTHKIAISNHRIKTIDENEVTFTYKDYRQNAQTKERSLKPLDFIQRFSIHILPKGFVRIRHFGILNSSRKKKTIPIIRKVVNKSKIRLKEPRKLTIYNPKICPHCKTETMITLRVEYKRGPPDLNKLLENIRVSTQ